MALSFAKGVLAISSGATGAHSITGLAFQPKAVIFFGAATNTTGSYVADEDIMLGCATAASEEWVVHASSNNQSTNTATARGRSDTACIRGSINGVSPATTVDFEADFTSMNSDGFTVNVSNGPTNNISVHYLAIGGSDITNAKAGVVTLPTSGGLSFTDPGFQPDMLLFGQNWADGANLRFSMGVADAAGAYNLHYGCINGSALVQSSTLQKAGATFSGTTNAFGPDMDIGFVSMDATGFTLGGGTPDYPASTALLNYLAIKGGQWGVGVETEGTSAAARDTSLSFTPTGLFMFGKNFTSSATYSSANDGLVTIGASDGTNEGCIWIGNDDANTDSCSFKRHDVSRAFWHAAAATSTAGPPTTVNEADASFATNKFTMTWNTAGSSREFVYLAGGSTPAAAGSLVYSPPAQIFPLRNL